MGRKKKKEEILQGAKEEENLVRRKASVITGKFVRVDWRVGEPFDVDPIQESSEKGLHLLRKVGRTGGGRARSR